MSMVNFPAAGNYCLGAVSRDYPRALGWIVDYWEAIYKRSNNGETLKEV